MPAKLLLTDSNLDEDDNYNLYVEGQVNSLDTLAVGWGGKAFFSHGASEGQLVLSIVDVLTKGKLELGTDSEEDYRFKTYKETNVKFGGTIVGNSLKVISPVLQIAYSGTINVNGNGNKTGMGTGAGQGGSGASYGGAGGTYLDGTGPVEPSLEPIDRLISMDRVEAMEAQKLMWGERESEGEAGFGAGGGGSGGSVDVTCSGISGSGMISVKGGDATTAGGGGGGRIVFQINDQYNYTGSFGLKGGNSNSSMAGGGGTALVKRRVNSRLQEELIIDNADIRGQTHARTVITVETSTAELNQLTIGDGVLLHFVSPNVSFTVKELACGEGSVLTIEDNVILEAETEKSHTKTSCSFHLKEEGELRLPSKVDLMGTNNVIEGILTNIAHLTIPPYKNVIFSSNARTAKFVGGVYEYKFEKGQYKFTSFSIRDHATVRFETTGNTLELGTLDLHYGSVLFGEELDLECNYISLHPGSTLDLVGGGFPSGVGPGHGGQSSSGYGTGGGHAAPGGSEVGSTGGQVYDKMRSPETRGSGGGSSSLGGAGGAGGGLLKIKVFRELNVEGRILVNGQDAQGENGGGGSGGTVRIDAESLVGHGVISADGGKGQGFGGGGAGGMILIQLKELSDFNGDFTAYGAGNDNDLATVKAGPGTVNVFEGTKYYATPFAHLMVFGDTDSEVQLQTRTLLSGDTDADFEYRTVTLTGHTHVEFEGSGTKANFKKIYGDKTAWVHVQEQQVLKAEIKEGVNTHFISSINIDVSEEATLHAPLKTTISGSELNLKGKFTVRNLVIEDSGIFRYYKTSVSVQHDKGEYEASDVAGVLSLDSLTLKRGSDLVPEADFTLRCISFDMKRYVVLEADSIDIAASTVILEREAELNVVGRGDPGLLLNENHGSGQTGGAHASGGGVGNGVDVDTAAQPYDTLYEPTKPGGDGGSGGSGGSVISVKTQTLFHLDGNLNAAGESSATGGGGAGGSIYVSSKTKIKGLGEMKVRGGDTSSTAAGAGSGGRIATYAGEDLFTGEGTYTAVGGDSPAQNGRGGPGTIYIKVTGGKEKLIADNKNEQENFYATLDEVALKLHFDEVEIKNYAKLQVIADNKDRFLSISKVTGDGTGLFRIQNNQEVELERIGSGTSSNSKLLVNLELNEGGKFKGAETTTILGEAPVALILDGIFEAVANLILGPKRKMTIGKAASIVPSGGGNAASDYRVFFTLFQADPGSSVIFEPNTGAKMMIESLHIKYDAELKADFFDLVCSDIEVELEALISSSSYDRPGSDSIDIELGTGGTDGSSTAGASHGAVGGGSTSLVGEPYGSLYEPNLPGSGKAGRGRGGGYIHIVTELLMNDGRISVDGGNSASGGGSGGSIWIKTAYVEGYGMFSSIGGSSSGNNGGASAGRVAMYSKYEMKFEGTYSVYGGSAGNDLNAGGGGTVYLEDTRKGQLYRRLLLDNLNRPIDKYILIDEDGQKEFIFEEVHLMRQASVHLKGDDLKINVSKFFGDGTGLVHLHDSHVLTAEYIEGILQAFTAPVNFIIDHRSEIIFPSFLYIYGSGVKMAGYEQEGRSLQHHGLITNVEHLSLGYETFWFLSGTAATASLSALTGKKIGPEGTVRLSSLDMKGLSTCKLDDNLLFNALIPDIDIRYNASISAESFNVSCKKLNIEAGAFLTVSSVHRPGDTVDSGSGMGHSTTTANEFASGAGHASRGGWVYQVGDTTIVRAAGDYYGSLWTPLERGSRGGSNTAQGPQGAAGKGGGLMNIQVDLALRLDGSLFADGSDGGSYAGGGSGGSILLTTATIAGHGLFSSVGGAGGTGGSGGRVTLLIKNDVNFFHGEFLVSGGEGSYSGDLSDGGPGTAYWSENRYGVDYNYFILDNLGRDWNHYTVLDEPGKTEYVFDEVFMYGSSTLQLKTGDGIDRTLTIEKIHGDKSARLDLKKGQTCYLEKRQPLTKTPINIFIDEGAVIHLSNILYILGKGVVAFFWNGEIIGVNHWRIVPGRNIEIGPNAQTSSMNAGVYKAGDPGKFKFSSIEVGAQSVIELPMSLILKVA
ncbi:hypothetical protein ScPMuIL_013264 [Solemya velum]